MKFKLLAWALGIASITLAPSCGNHEPRNFRDPSLTQNRPPPAPQIKATSSEHCSPLSDDPYTDLIEPLMANACLSCHGPTGANHQDFAGDDPFDARQWQSASSAVTDGRMPPGEPLGHCAKQWLAAYAETISANHCGQHEPEEDFARVVAPTIASQCVSCHQAAKPSGGIILEGHPEPAVWRQALQAIAASRMPPNGPPLDSCVVATLGNYVNYTSQQGLLDFDRDIAPIIKENCASCHHPDDGGIRLDVLVDPEDWRSTQERWQLVLDLVTSQRMPPQPMALSPGKIQRLSRFVSQLQRTLPKSVRPNDPPPTILAKDELGFAIKDLLGTEAWQAVASLVADYPSNWTSSEKPFVGSSPPIDAARILTLNEVANQLGEYFAASPKSLSRLAPCTLQPQDNRACFDKVWSALAQPLYRELMPWSDMALEAAAVYDPGLSFENNIKNLISYLFQAPRFVYRLPLQNGPNAGRINLGGLLASKVWRSVPSMDLLKQVAAMPAAPQAALEKLLADVFTADKAARSLEAIIMRLFFHEPLTSLSMPDFYADGLDLDQAVTGADRELSMFIKYVLFKGRGGLKQLLQSRFGIADNQTLARIYEVEQSPRPIFLPDRPGIFTRAAYLLNRGLEGNVVSRGVRIRSGLLCEQMLPPVFKPKTDKIEAFTTEILNPLSMPQRQYWEQLTGEAGCATCHNRINPVGLSFQKYDSLGRYLAMDVRLDIFGEVQNTFAFDSKFLPRVTSLDDTETNSLPELLQHLYDHPKTYQCLNRQLFRYVYNQDPIEDDQEAFAQFVDGRTKSKDAAIVDLLKDMVLRQVFQAIQTSQTHGS